MSTATIETSAAAMSAKTSRAALLEAVEFASLSISSRPALPVLGGIKLIADEHGLTVEAFDYDTSSKLTIPGRAESVGEALVSGPLLKTILKTADSDDIHLSIDDRHLAVRGGQDVWTLQLLPVEDYPKLPSNGDPITSVLAEDFIDAVLTVAPALGKDLTLPTLTGMLMELEGHILTLIATDRYRLAVREIHTHTPANAEKLLVPGRHLLTIAKWLKKVKASGDVKLSLIGVGTDRTLGIECDGFRYTIGLLDGEFPKYRSLLPQEIVDTATFDAKNAIRSVKKASVVASKNTPIRLTVGRGGEGITIQSGDGDQARASIRLDSTGVKEEFSIAFNPQFFLEGITAVGGDTVHLEYVAQYKPGYLRGESGTRYLLMPVRLSS